MGGPLLLSGRNGVLGVSWVKVRARGGCVDGVTRRCVRQRKLLASGGVRGPIRLGPCSTLHSMACMLQPFARHELPRGTCGYGCVAQGLRARRRCVPQKECVCVSCAAAMCWPLVVWCRYYLLSAPGYTSSAITSRTRARADLPKPRSASSADPPSRPHSFNERYALSSPNRSCHGLSARDRFSSVCLLVNRPDCIRSQICPEYFLMRPVGTGDYMASPAPSVANTTLATGHARRTSGPIHS